MDKMNSSQMTMPILEWHEALRPAPTISNRFVSSLVGYIILITTIALARSYIQRYFKNRKEDSLGKQNRCELPHMLESNWPLGIDLISKIIAAGQDKRVCKFFCKMVDGAGDTFSWFAIGLRCWATTNPENVEAILSTFANDFGHDVRRAVVGSLIGDGIFTQDGAAWKHSRALLRPQLLKKRYSDLNIFREHVDNMIRYLPSNGGKVDLQPLFFRLTMDASTAFLFGKSVNSLNPDQAEDAENFTEAFQFAQEYVKKRYQLGGMCWLMNSKKYQKACRTVHGFVDNLSLKAIQTRKARTNSSGEFEATNLLDSLVCETQDRVELRSHVLHLLLAGRDTTATLLSWTMRLLAIYPNVLERVREEIASTFEEDEEITYEGLRKLTYLSCVLKEVLRLYPSVPINSRTALRTVILPRGGGADRQHPVMIRKGEDVSYCTYAMHRRKDIYGDDADIFRPERWENEQLRKVENSYGYIPFHAGPRICPGQDFALTETLYTIVRLVQRFDGLQYAGTEELLPLGEEQQNLGLVLVSADGCWVDLKSAGVS
ncbi:n-alkane-inducible cytochrome P450 [Rhexocercosporidium sp. MPI-PUGE-AT-0058]|nr:n-alkane-inducible cytochrome P450 [Rhexocercosporidium sp. MPI-PUGE-AT-0058]